MSKSLSLKRLVIVLFGFVALAMEEERLREVDTFGWTFVLDLV